MGVRDKSNTEFFKEPLHCNIRIYFSPIYKKRLIEIKEENNFEEREIINRLIDLSYVETGKDLSWFRKSLIKRLKKGVGYSYIVQLKLIYIIIGDYLKRIENV